MGTEPMVLFLFIFLGLVSGLPDFHSSIASRHEIPQRKLVDAQCPLDFDVLREIVIKTSQRLHFHDVPTECQHDLDSIRLVRSHYLRITGFFLPPPNASEACWISFQALVNEFIPGFDARSACGFHTSLLSQGCMNITSASQFESLIPKSQLWEIQRFCNQSLEDTSPCASCTKILSTLQSSYLGGPDDKNASDCIGYPFIYAAALANQFGPTDFGTAKCLFSLDFTSTSTSKKRHRNLMFGVLMGCVSVFLGIVLVGLIFWRRHKKWRKDKKSLAHTQMGSVSGLEMISRSTTSVRFTFEEIKKATRNFPTGNLIGKGGYGNVYKGILPDGSEVALKRFKNCSAAGNANFTHEVEVIASVRHVNLVGLRGYCTTTDPLALEGHQRIIVCDLVRNGSLYDHLFGSGVKKKLSWPIRQKIALGTARGLAYLHYGAQLSIIHRDIKASNILLDETFEPKLADFGLAKFTPEGMSHLSTKVAGTIGYVAPEYALYGQLTERSDVYSFGVVLLELLSGKPALILTDNGETSLLADWAWSLVREGRVFDVIEEGMANLGPPEIMEKYILVAVLSSHPLLYARPTMDQIVKILETNLPVPPIPDRPTSLIAEIEDVGGAMSFTDSYCMSNQFEQQSFVFRSDNPTLDQRENEGILQ